MENFKDLNLSPALSSAIEELGYTAPTPIQAQTLPMLLEGPTDFLGLAATGTGKTAAFGIPLLEKIDQTRFQVQALVLCPTRELAIQVTEQLNLLGKHKKVRAVPVYGGAGYSDQIRGLKGGAHIVVATPGRLIDHLERGTVRLENVQTVVLDEADEMISMGFKDEIEKILETMPEEQYMTWLFSATMSKEVRRVADKFLSEPKMVQVNKTEMLSGTVEQIYYKVKETDKPDIVCKIIDIADEFYGLIFCQTKSLVADLSRFLTDRGYKVECLHGDKDQNQRERTLRAFRDRRVNILVCTDVAARGLDVKDLTHVINYSIPRELDNYVHRIGRTGRSGKKGLAISLVTQSHMGLIGRIEQMTKSKLEVGKIPTRKEVGAKKVSRLLEKFQSVATHDRVESLLDESWINALEAMSKNEIASRLLVLTFPEVFIDHDKAGAAQMPGNPLSGSGMSRDDRSDSSGRGERRSRNRDYKQREPQFEKPVRDFTIEHQPMVKPLEKTEVKEKLESPASNASNPSHDKSLQQFVEDSIGTGPWESGAWTFVKSDDKRPSRKSDREPRKFGREKREFDREPRKFGREKREFDREPRRFGREKREFDREPRRFGGEKREFDREPRRFGREKREFDREPRRFGGEKREFDREPRRFGREKREFDREPRKFGREKREFDREPRKFGGEGRRFGKDGSRTLSRRERFSK